MAGSSSRDLHGPAENLTSDEHSEAIADNTDSDDMDYEPATEEEGDDLSDEGFLQRFLEEEEAIEEDGEDEGELDSSILMFKLPANFATKLSCSTMGYKARPLREAMRLKTQLRENEVSPTSYLLSSRLYCSYFDSKPLGKEDRL
jgi:hypothetical protein